LHAARKIALDAGLHYVYEGNIYSGAAHTFCPGCGKLLIRRSWHEVLENALSDGACPTCRRKIPGRWTNASVPQVGIAQRAHALAARKYGALNL